MSRTSTAARDIMAPGDNEGLRAASSAPARLLSIPTLLLTTGSLLLPTPPEWTTG
jgi:hypothetical protein